MINSGDILRVNGFINTVNDAVIGGIEGISGASKVAGQLGQYYQAEDANLFYDSTMGTVYGGYFQYVRLAAAATAVAVGQIVFWDDTVAQNLFQVTTSEAGTTATATKRAGIVLNSDWEAGNYSFIQVLGPTMVLFANPLTGTPETGGAVFAGAFGAGANNGLADVYDLNANPMTFNDYQLLMNRYLGVALALPVAGAASLVQLNWLNARS